MEIRITLSILYGGRLLVSEDETMIILLKNNLIATSSEFQGNVPYMYTTRAV